MVVAASGWTNPCGGAKWRSLPDGRFEIEGQGILDCAPGSVCEKNVLQTYRNWEPAFQAVAKRHGIPVSWLVALATNETGFLSSKPDQQRTVASSDGYGSIGIMQPLPGEVTRLGFSLADRTDPEKNIEIGARILKEGLVRTKGDFPAASVLYNAGHLCPTQSNLQKGNYNAALNVAGYKGVYLPSAVRHNNTAVRLGVNASASRAGMLVGGALALGLGALAGFFAMKH
jgi:soluble lytic murein transglycosylase-like protein